MQFAQGFNRLFATRQNIEQRTDVCQFSFKIIGVSLLKLQLSIEHFRIKIKSENSNSKSSDEATKHR